MSKVVATYWDNPQTVWIKPPTAATPRRNRVAIVKRQSKAAPQWAAFAVIVSITFMLCLTINLRAFSEMHQEINSNENLSLQIEGLTSENLTLQEEIHDLKSDLGAVEREARKIGMGRPNEKILAPAN